ncbi:MAG: DUF58 domain-containing protein [Pseudomonadales bacterium]|nr:DUF58 domain-containing protein [Pseudomonadales bacterium]
MPALIATRFRARLLALFPGQRAQAQSAGTRASAFRGRGLEFEEVRHYQAGDELRAIDWRVTARTGVAHTKLFREERERPVLLLVDLRARMGFGSVQRFKSVAATEAAALLAWATLHNGDRIGGFVFGTNGHQEIRPARSAGSVLRLLQTMHAECNELAQAAQGGRARQTTSAPGSLASMLGELRRVARPGAGIFILSDFHDFNDDCAAQLHLLKRHCDVEAIRVLDPLEQQLPDGGLLAFRAGNQRIMLDTHQSVLRERFKNAHDKAQKNLLDAMAERRIALHTLSTADDAESRLSSWFHPRATRAARAAQNTSAQ